MKCEIEVLQSKVEEQKLRAKRDALQAEVARGGEGERSGETTARRLLLCQHLGWQPNQAHRKFLHLVRIRLN